MSSHHGHHQSVTSLVPERRLARPGSPPFLDHWLVSVWQVAAGRADAALRLALLGLDQFTPHEHVYLGAGARLSAEPLIGEGLIPLAIESSRI